ncbi:MAG: hypothetical protein KF906_05470 [Actinobacteria bacterium]|nr:hypothetical protein [Actinomycetota bacterium]
MVASVFVLYYTTDGDILWGKTLLVNGAIWGGLYAVIALIRWAWSALRPEPPARASTRVPEAPTTVVPRSVDPVPASPEPGPDVAPGASKLRVSMGRNSAPSPQPAVAPPAGPTARAKEPQREPVARCEVCATVLPSVATGCPVCGHGGRMR